MPKPTSKSRNVFVALLRGVNVGGKNNLSMSSLKTNLSKAGFEDVGTYINSGNVLFTSSQTDARKLETRIERLLSDQHKLACKVVVRSLAEMKKLVEGLPASWNGDDQWAHNVMFLRHSIDSRPFSGAKGSLLEGGIRVPAIVRWPGMVPARRVTHQPAITMDWTATILAAAETKPAEGYPLDGINLLPLIRGASTVVERTFFWRIYDRDAVRQGKWKYVRDGERRSLFDLSGDQHEQADFSKKNAEILTRLTAEFDKWNREMLPRPKGRG